MLLLSALLAVALTSPSLFGGLQTEDHVQRAQVLNSEDGFPWRINLYGHHGHRSWDAIEKRNALYRILGWFPWVTPDRFDVSFWRPLSSLTHHLEYTLYPETPWLMHAANLGWYTALVVAVGLVFRRLAGPPWAAGFAAVLYAIDDAHGHAVGWLANRNGIMAAFFGTLSLYFFDRFRRSRERWAAGLVPVTLLLGLLSAEAALSVVGYFLAYAFFVETDSVRSRGRAALLWLLPVAGWAILYRALGHATFGSGLYINPMSEPLAFAFGFLERGTVLLAAQLAGPPSNWWTLSSVREQGFVVFASAVVVWFTARVLWPMIRRDRRQCFWATGTILSLAPLCAAFPEDRLLFLAGLGAMPVVVAVIRECLREEPSAWCRGWAPKMLGTVFVVMHLVVAAGLLPLRSLYMKEYDARLAHASATLFEHATDPDEDTLVVTHAEDFYFASMMPLVRAARGKPTASRVLTLAGTFAPVRITRLDETSFRVRPEHGFFSRVLNRIFRGRAVPMRRGEMVDLGGAHAEVTDVDLWGAPTEAVFRFSVSLDHPHIKWVRWENGAYRSIDPPRVGQALIVRSDP